MHPNLILTSIFLAAASLSAQDRSAEVLRPATPVQLRAGEVFLDLIAVKFVEGHEVRLGEAGLRCATLDLGPVTRLLGQRPVTRMLSRPVAEVDRETVELERRSGVDLADLNNYYFVQTGGKLDSERLLNALLEEAVVETAYAEPIPVRTGDIAPPTPTFESRQTYMAAAPSGHAHWLTREIDGAQGIPSQIVAQLEGAWFLGHEDADELIASHVIGTTSFGNYNSSSWTNHGTACFGIMNASRNAWGVTGFAPLASGRVSSLANGSTNMINMCTAAGKAGDVFSSSFAYVINGRHSPLDYTQGNFDAVKRAAAKGICYTFSAGNSGVDIATVSTRHLPSAPDSGGFIIGGTSAGNTTRASGSNWGAKVVANGWYSSVTTLGYGNLFFPGNDTLQSYSRSFGGTSAAAPQVAGVIASIQGASMRQNGAPLPVAQIRSLLKTHGTAISGSQNIGLRPDLMKLMTAAGLLDGLRTAREASVGGRFDMEVKVGAARTWTVFGAFDRGTVDLGLNRDVLLDPATLFFFEAGNATDTRTYPIPNDPTLRGLSIFLQMLDTNGSNFHVSNSIEAFIR